MRQRLEYVDSVKGFAILLVVMGHVIAWFFESYKDALPLQPSPMQLWHVIYSFHMPLFMFVSGFLFGLSHFATFKEYVVKMWKKALMLIVPWFAAGVLLKYIRGGVFWLLVFVDLVSANFNSWN